MDLDVVGGIEKPLADLNETDYRRPAYRELNKAPASYFYELIQSASTVLPRSDQESALLLQMNENSDNAPTN